MTTVSTKRRASTATSQRPVLSAAGLTKRYGAAGQATTTALDGFDLEVTEGEFLAIMGPSGSGKTTLLNILSTIDTPTSGRVSVNGIDPAGMGNDDLARFRRRELGFVFQDFNLLDTLSIRENILLPLVLDRKPQREMRERLERITSVLGIGDILDRKPHSVSGGQQQRAAIARALIHDPALLLADEPTGNLDSAASFHVMTALRSLNESREATVLMVTHDPFAASFCKRILFINDGRPFSELRQSGNRQAFFQQILDALSVLGGSFNDVSINRGGSPDDVPAARPQ